MNNQIPKPRPLGVLFQNAICTEFIHSLHNVLSITTTLQAIM